MAGPSTVGRKLIRTAHVGNVLATGAAGEMLADKHPSTPNRNSAAPLAARTIAGAATGAAIVVSGAGWRRDPYLRSRRYRHHLYGTETIEAAAVGAIVGGICAFIGTHASYHMRKYASARTAAPNVVLGAVEDVVVYATAIALADTLD
jgi:uncharacterized membrane protein